MSHSDYSDSDYSDYSDSEMPSSTTLLWTGEPCAMTCDAWWRNKSLSEKPEKGGVPVPPIVRRAMRATGIKHVNTHMKPPGTQIVREDDDCPFASAPTKNIYLANTDLWLWEKAVEMRTIFTDEMLMKTPTKKLKKVVWAEAAKVVPSMRLLWQKWRSEYPDIKSIPKPADEDEIIPDWYVQLFQQQKDALLKRKPFMPFPSVDEPEEPEEDSDSELEFGDSEESGDEGEGAEKAAEFEIEDPIETDPESDDEETPASPFVANKAPQPVIDSSDDSDSEEEEEKPIHTRENLTHLEAGAFANDANWTNLRMETPGGVAVPALMARALKMYGLKGQLISKFAPLGSEKATKSSYLMNCDRLLWERALQLSATVLSDEVLLQNSVQDVRRLAAQCARDLMVDLRKLWTVWCRDYPAHKDLFPDSEEELYDEYVETWFKDTFLQQRYALMGRSGFLPLTMPTVEEDEDEDDECEEDCDPCPFAKDESWTDMSLQAAKGAKGGVAVPPIVVKALEAYGLFGPFVTKVTPPGSHNSNKQSYLMLSDLFVWEKVQKLVPDHFTDEMLKAASSQEVKKRAENCAEEMMVELRDLWADWTEKHPAHKDLIPGDDVMIDDYLASWLKDVVTQQRRSVLGRSTFKPLTPPSRKRKSEDERNTTAKVAKK
uniref:Protein ORF111 n=1 Tax=Anguillid herpesvirus 1 TaxID=150286 RepID=A0A8E5AM03_9VIRU|nr:protein ORF111 [Anguillid herpesvirus 1]